MIRFRRYGSTNAPKRRPRMRASEIYYTHTPPHCRARISAGASSDIEGAPHGCLARRGGPRFFSTRTLSSLHVERRIVDAIESA